VGGVSIEIRESPGLPSPGETSVLDNGDDTFQIDSFFDVFIELSVDGGPFQPQTNGAGRMDLEPIRPSVDLPSPNLPPEPNPTDCDAIVSQYAGIDLHALFPNGIDFSNPRHRCFENVVVATDPGTGDETEQFDSRVDGIFDDGSGPQLVELTGPVKIITRGKGGATTGSWQTEILSMDLTGDVGGVSIEIRESPGLPSPGEVGVADNGDGTFQIDSFFDVFTELSVDGGPFQPQTNEASRLDLVRKRPSAILPSPALPAHPGGPRPVKHDRLGPAAVIDGALDGGIDRLGLVARRRVDRDLRVLETLVDRVAEVDAAREQCVDVAARVLADDALAVRRVALRRQVRRFELDLGPNALQLEARAGVGLGLERPAVHGELREDVEEAVDLEVAAADVLDTCTAR
jgi:hypothetical protein